MSLPFLSPPSHPSSPLAEVVLRVVQPQADRNRVALPALSENVVHSSVPQSPLDWESVGTVEGSWGGEPQALSLRERKWCAMGVWALRPQLLDVCKELGEAAEWSWTVSLEREGKADRAK